MQAKRSPSPTAISTGLLWVFSPSGWALGWASESQPILDQMWPQGEPPIDCPAPDLAWALRQALATQAERDLALHLLVCAGSIESRPPWWPDARRRLQPWREMAHGSRLRLESVRVLDDEWVAPSLWEWAQRAWPQAIPLRGLDGWGAWVPRNPWAAFAASTLTMCGLHWALTDVVRPWLVAQRLALRQQESQAQEEALAHQAQARAQALVIERQTQKRVWQQRQREALAPLEQWLAIVALAERAEPIQWWSEMRWSQDAWTVWGLTTHDAGGGDGSFAGLGSWQIERIESAPTVWPSSPPWGYPAWRYQLRLQAPRPERALGTQETP